MKPHRLEGYLASNDPDFETQAADVIGLYLNPPQHAAVFSVDEKTAVQALDPKDPVLALSPARAERHGFEYFRHGTLSRYAAFNTKTGDVLGKIATSLRPSVASCWRAMARRQFAPHLRTGFAQGLTRGAVILFDYPQRRLQADPQHDIL